MSCLQSKGTCRNRLVLVKKKINNLLQLFGVNSFWGGFPRESPFSLIQPYTSYLCCSLSPGPAQKREGLVTLAKILVCAVSVWSRGITFVHCQLTTFLTHEGSRLIPRPLKNGNEASRLFVNLDFQELRAYLYLLGYYSCLTRFACSRFVTTSVHILCIAIVNSSWLAHMRKFASVTTVS